MSPTLTTLPVYCHPGLVIVPNVSYPEVLLRIPTTGSHPIGMVTTHSFTNSTGIVKEDLPFGKYDPATIAALLEDILAGNYPKTTQTQYISPSKESSMIQNIKTPREDDKDDVDDESHICLKPAQSFTYDFTIHCENPKSDVRELNTIDLPDFVTI